MKEQDEAAQLNRREPCQEGLDVLSQELTRERGDTAQETPQASTVPSPFETSLQSHKPPKWDQDPSRNVADLASQGDEHHWQKATAARNGDTLGARSSDGSQIGPLPTSDLEDRENKEVQGWTQHTHPTR